MKWLWLLLLPVIWVPLLALVVIAGPVVPWYGWAFALVFFALLWRRRQMRAAGVEGSSTDPAGPLFSPTHRSGGLW